MRAAAAEARAASAEARAAAAEARSSPLEKEAAAADTRAGQAAALAKKLEDGANRCQKEWEVSYRGGYDANNKYHEGLQKKHHKELDGLRTKHEEELQKTRADKDELSAKVQAQLVELAALRAKEAACLYCSGRAGQVKGKKGSGKDQGKQDTETYPKSGEKTRRK